jgi:hypothetical protein
LPAAGGRIVVHVADTAALIHHFDAHDVSPVKLNTLGTQDPAATLRLRTPHRIGGLVARASAFIVKATTRRSATSTRGPLLWTHTLLRPGGPNDTARKGERQTATMKV